MSEKTKELRKLQNPSVFTASANRIESISMDNLIKMIENADPKLVAIRFTPHGGLVSFYKNNDNYLGKKRLVETWSILGTWNLA